MKVGDLVRVRPYGWRALVVSPCVVGQTIKVYAIKEGKIRVIDKRVLEVISECR